MRFPKVLCLACLFLAFLEESSLAQKVQYKSLSDTAVAKYVIGGYTRDGKLHLMVNEDYLAIDITKKQAIINTLAKHFPNTDVTVYHGSHYREMWISSGVGLYPIEQWDNNNLQMEKYIALSLSRGGNSKFFYSVGGFYNLTDAYSNGTLNLRAGTFLFKDILDVSALVGLGWSTSTDNNWFTGNLGVDSRYYLPFRTRSIRLAPFVGGGVVCAFVPDFFIDLRFLAGVCWYISSGTLDIGMQYDIQGGLSAMIGYTIHPNIFQKE